MPKMNKTYSESLKNAGFSYASISNQSDFEQMIASSLWL